MHTEDADIHNLLYTCAGDAFSFLPLINSGKEEGTFFVAVLSFPPEGGGRGMKQKDTIS